MKNSIIKVIHCIVPGCPNTSEQGSFEGNLCMPCYKCIKDRVYTNSTVDRLYHDEIEKFWKKMELLLEEK